MLTCNLLFFFISGALLLPYREETIGQYYRKRVVKIVLPFAVYSLFYLKLLVPPARERQAGPEKPPSAFLAHPSRWGPIYGWMMLLALYLLVPFTA